MESIESESQFIWKFIWHIFLTPYTFILILFNKKEFRNLFQPFTDLFKFIFEPKFTISIIIINIAIFFGSFYFLSEQILNSFINYPTDLLDLRLYTLATAGFLHVDLSHLIGNMIGIFIFGRVVERKLGFFKTLLVYFGALILSSLFESLINLFITGNDVGWLAIYGDIAGVLNPSQDGIGHFAHLGGFISIGLLMFLIGIDERSKLKRGLIINIISLVIMVILYFLLIQYGYS